MAFHIAALMARPRLLGAVTDQHAIVFGNGERPPEFLKEVAQADGVRLIGVDGGTRWILRWGLVPDVAIGDLDSMDDRTKAYADKFGAPIDQTDDEPNRADLARVIDRLIDEGAREVTFTGCVGSRIDLMFALFQGMARLALAGTQVHVVERWGSGHVATPAHRVELMEYVGESVSVFPLTADVDGLAISGVDAGETPPTAPRPPFDGLVGMPVVTDPAEVEVSHGAVLVLVPRKESADDPGAEKGPTPTYRLGTLERTG